MALYNVFLAGQEGALNPALVTGGGVTAQVAGLMVSTVSAASAAAAGAAVQAALPGAGNQQGLMHIWLQSNDNTA